ncbi:MAG: methyltransferase domain-containing protein [Pseudonocardiaceae bacterium]|nr:methyltransferase domain-containing protein [Pseudonocardiaceae bacterium]
MSAADVLHPVLCAVLGPGIAIRVRCWDGSEAGPADAPLRLSLRNRRALRRLLWAPNELGLARAYVSGDIDAEGDLYDGLAQLDRVVHPEEGAPLATDWATKRAGLKAALRLGAIGPPPKPPAEEVRLHGRLHSLRRDADAIAHHYNVGNDFYALVLGSTMTYSCAYWAADPGRSYTLDEAQIAKCDLVARKLGLTEGMRVLDVGCGWGSFVLHAAHKYGVRAVGVTLSEAQAEFARERAKEDGLADLVEIRVEDYRDVTDGPYDAIASIGMAEHVGMSMLPTYAADLFALLRPEGRLLNHAISRRPERASDKLGALKKRPFTKGAQYEKSSFIDRYVFPDGELEPIGVMVNAIEDAGFEVRDVESLREHYALTLRAWVENLEARWDEAVRLASPGRARVWRLYMAASALTFSAGRIGVNQVLAVKPGPRGSSGMPRIRSF